MGSKGSRQDREGSPAIDFVDAIARLGGDEALFGELCQIMIENAPMAVAAMRSALERERAADFRAAAHKVKGSLGVFGCARAYELAGELEALGSRGEMTAAKAMLPGFLSEFDAVVETLSQVAVAA